MTIPFLSFHREAIQHQSLLRASQATSSLLYFQNPTTLRRSPVREEGRAKPRLAPLLNAPGYLFCFPREKKIILTARLPDLFHHRLNPKPRHCPGISPLTVWCLQRQGPFRTVSSIQVFHLLYVCSSPK